MTLPNPRLTSYEIAGIACVIGIVLITLGGIAAALWGSVR